MNTLHRSKLIIVMALLLLSLSGCSGMSEQDRNTALGAGAGAIGGSVLTGGSTMGTIGGVIGHEISKPE